MAYYLPYSSLNSTMATFNMNDGYLEGYVRGLRKGILSTSDYVNLTQCEVLEGTHRVWSARRGSFFPRAR